MMPSTSTIPPGTRFLIVVGSWELGGSERQALELATLLRETFQAEVALSALVGTRGTLLDLAQARQIPTRSLNCGRAAKRWGKLGVLREVATFAAAVRSWQPQVIWPFTLMPNVWCQWIRPCSGARLVLWNQRDLGLGWRNTTPERWALHRARQVLANSPAVSDFLQAQWQVPAERIRILPNVVVPPRALSTRDEWRARLELSASDWLVVMPARLDGAKDHATLLIAWQQVQQQLPRQQRAVLVLAGRAGDTAASLRVQAQQLDLADTVRFLGECTDVGGLLAAADAGVYSSRSEGCPNGLLECLAAGLPIVATDIPGVQFAVGPALFEQLVPVGDAAALADKLLRTLTQREQHARLGALGQAHLAAHFSVAAQADAIAALWTTSARKA